MPGVASRTVPADEKNWPGLTAMLARLDDGGLVTLLTLRPDLARPTPRDLVSLAARAGSWPSVRDCYTELDRASQRVVDALCLLPRPATVEAVAGVLGVPADDAALAGALHRVEQRALAFRTSPTELRLLPAFGQLDYPAGLGPPLAAMLGTMTGPALDQVATRLGAKPGRSKAATMVLVTGILSDPDQVARLIEQGPPGTADLARRVAGGGPLVNVQAGLYSVSDRTPAGWLCNRAMLGVVDYYTGVMPREPAIALRGGRAFPPGCLRRPAPELAPVDAGAVDRAAAERALRVVADLTAVLELWVAEPPSVLKAGGLGVREVRRGAKVTDRTEATTARVMELAAVAGLARADPVTETVLPTVAYDGWLALEAPARWVHLASAWLAAELHLSLAGAISTKDKPIPPLLDRGPEGRAIRRRELVLGALAAQDPGRAIGSASVRELVEWDGPGTWGGGPATSPMLIGWVLEEADLLGLTALGTLGTAGRALVAGRPDAAGAALAALAPPAVAEFVVQTDMTAVVAGEPAVAVRAELELLADVESKGAATVFRFTEASLRRAFDLGRTSDDILAFLERHATRGVPQPLAYLVNDLGRRFGNVRVGTVASYLRSDDPSLLAEVLQARRTAALRLRPLAPTVLVTDVDAATVTDTLQKAGYLPAREGADGALLVARPSTRRLPERARRSPPLSGPGGTDLAAVVSDMRRMPVPGPPAHPAPRPAPAPVPSRHQLQPTLADAFRPTEIVKASRAVRALLTQACEEFWVVRLSYVAGNGRATELTVEPTDLDGRHLYASCFPAGNERTFVVDRIEWARVLTEAEEDLLP